MGSPGPCTAIFVANTWDEKLVKKEKIKWIGLEYPHVFWNIIKRIRQRRNQIKHPTHHEWIKKSKLSPLISPFHQLLFLETFHIYMVICIIFIEAMKPILLVPPIEHRQNQTYSHHASFYLRSIGGLSPWFGSWMEAFDVTTKVWRGEMFGTHPPKLNGKFQMWEFRLKMAMTQNLGINLKLPADWVMLSILILPAIGCQWAKNNPRHFRLAQAYKGVDTCSNVSRHVWSDCFWVC